MPFIGPLYSQYDYLDIVKYKHIIPIYIICMNTYDSINFNMKKLLYIDGHPHTHGSIVGFINGYRFSLITACCLFEEHSNGNDLFMKRKTSLFFRVHVVRSLSSGDKLLRKYNFCGPRTSHKRQFALGLPLDVPLRHKRNIIE